MFKADLSLPKLQNAKFYKTEGVQQATKVLVKPQGDMGNNKESWEGILQVSQA